MIGNFKHFVNKSVLSAKKHQADIVLIIAVILVSLLSFASGYIMAKRAEKAPIIFENTQK